MKLRILCDVCACVRLYACSNRNCLMNITLDCSVALRLLLLYCCSKFFNSIITDTNTPWSMNHHLRSYFVLLIVFPKFDRIHLPARHEQMCFFFFLLQEINRSPRLKLLFIYKISIKLILTAEQMDIWKFNHFYFCNLYKYLCLYSVCRCVGCRQ